MSSDCINMRFGYSNRVPDCTMTADPAASTPISYIKDQWASRLAVWPLPNSSDEIVITGTASGARRSQFFAIAGVRLMGDVEVKIKLFLNTAPTVDQLNMDFESVRRYSQGVQVPLGTWQSDVHSFGFDTDGAFALVPNTFVYWYDEPIYWDRWELTIRRSADSSEEMTDVRMQTLFMGDMLEMQNNMTYGSAVRFVNKLERKQTAGGSWVKTRRVILGREMNLSLDMISDEDYFFLQQFESAQMGAPFIFSAFPKSDTPWIDNNTNMMAIMGDELWYTHSSPGVRKATMKLLEV